MNNCCKRKKVYKKVEHRALVVRAKKNEEKKGYSTMTRKIADMLLHWLMTIKSDTEQKLGHSPIH